MQGFRREPGSVTAIRSRSSSVVTSTVSDRRGPTFAWTTLLVTSSLTSSATSDAVVAGIWPSSFACTDLRARVGASSPPGIRMKIDPCDSGGWNADAVMRRPAAEKAAATEWSEGHALRPKRVADDPSFELSRDLLAEGPQSPRGDRPERLPSAVWLLPQRDLGDQSASHACEQQGDARAVGVLGRRLLCKRWTSSRLGAPSQGAGPSPRHNSRRTTGSDRRAMSTALSLLTGAALLLQRPRQPPIGRCRRAIRLLVWIPTLLAQRAGEASVQISTLLLYGRRATRGSPGVRSARGSV